MARLSIARLAAAAALVLPMSVLAQAPEEEPYFMGWYLAPDSTEAINCQTDEVHTTMSGDRNYAACCKSDDANCRIATDCYGTTVLYNDNSTMECTSGNYCMSFSILQSFPDGQPSAVQLWCNTFWRAHTVYKELPTAAAQTAAKTVTVTSTAIPEATVTFTSPVETATPGASQNGDDGGSAGASNKAWVAGAVIGPVAALGLISLAFWYGRRRAMKGNDTTAASSAVAGAGAGAAGGQYHHTPRGSVNPNHAATYGPMSQPPMSSAGPSPGYAPFTPGQHPPPPNTAVPSYYFQGNPGANQYPPMPAAQQSSYPAGYWGKESPHSSQSTPMSADASLAQSVHGSAYPPTTPGNPNTGYYTHSSPHGEQTPHIGQRSELDNQI